MRMYGHARRAQIIIKREPPEYHKEKTLENNSQTDDKQLSTDLTTSITYMSQIFMTPWDTI